MFTTDRFAGKTTYRPGPHEAAWLERSLASAFDDGLLTDVLFNVRSGKEADVYACRGGRVADGALLAAKIYRPAKLRHLRNDAIYREGRALLDDKGRAVHATKHRVHRAVQAGSRFGRAARHTSWLVHEVTSMQRAHAAGVRVPKIWGWSDNAVIMDFIGDEEGGAPSLRRVQPDPTIGGRIAEELLADLEKLTGAYLVHADLSAYNLLLWNEQAWWIDFPQACDLFENPHARDLLERDVQQLCRDLSRWGVRLRWEDVVDDMWDRVFGTEDGVPQAAII